MAKIALGVIGGSGFYGMEGLSEVEEINISTPFGDPSDKIVVGTLEGMRVAFLARHGRDHGILPSEIPVRANIWALKSLGVERVLSVTAVGSLREEMRPLDLVIPEQLIDRTTNRERSFFGGGIVAHVGMADPFCPALRGAVICQARSVEGTVHHKGTLVVMEGPQFSTRAESEVHRSIGADIINMTALPEAKLAREAGICYATLACVTDYDVWHQSEEDVTADTILAVLRSGVEKSKKILRSLIQALPEQTCSCRKALEGALLTPRSKIPETVRRKLQPILG